MQRLGITNVSALLGGFDSWRNRGLPLEVGATK
jgi:rhodanese-related sulfurtransferase